MRTLAVRMNEAATKSTGPAARALRTLGLSARDAAGNLKSTQQILAEVADKFEGYADGANKTAIATALFGEQGARLIPLLNQGASGIAKLKAESDSLGTTITQKVSKATIEYNKTLVELNKAKDGFIMSLNEKLLPVLTLLAKTVKDFVTDGDRMKEWAENIAESLEWVSRAALRASMMISVAKAIGSGLWDSLFSSKNFDQIKEEFAAKYLDIVKTLIEGQRKIDQAMMGRLLKPSIMPHEADDPSPKKDDAPALAAAIDKVKEHTRALTEKTEKMELERQLLGATTYAQTFANEKLEFENMLRKENLRISDKQRGAVMARIEALAKEAEATEQARQAYDRFRENVDTFKSAFSSAIDKMLEGTFKFRDAMRDLLKNLIKLWANQAFTGLFGSGDKPGAINLASIFGFGGGKASGGDLLAGRAYTVGEMGKEVFVPRVPGQLIPNHELRQMGGAAGSSMSVVINAQGADPAGLARVELAVRDLNQNFERRVAASQRVGQVRRVRP